ncbi:MAG: Iron uptake system component EfeO [Stenotrophomonas maltophilia]|nr:MAG: Iron uptake system component EfeO [Stenotrophomonas maltophilia]
MEWEILDGVMVVEERENIAPGIGQPLSVDLKPGQYQITCGLLSNPRGSLTVTATAASEAASKARSPLLDMLGPLAEYRVYLNGRFNATRDAVERLQQALDAGDLNQAQLAYAQARGAFAQVAATAQRFAELDNRVEPRADSFEQREQAPAFGGFHRIEYGLFQQHATQGLAPVAQRLHDDLAQLKDAVMGQSLPPEQLSGNLARNLHDLAEQRALNGSEEHYSHLDAGVFAGNLSTARKVIDLLRPQLTHRAPALLQRLDSARWPVEGRQPAL